MANMEKMAKKANLLKQLDKSAEDNYRKATLLFRMGRFEEALAAYGEAAGSWREIAEVLFDKGKENSGKEFLEKVQEARSG